MIGVSHICSPDELFNHLSKKKSHWVLKRGAYELLKDLKNKKFELALISNFNFKEAIRILKRLKIESLFDYLHISEKESLEKPNIEFYNKFFVKNKILKKDCLYIGDSYTLDFIPSNKINLSFILLDEYNLFNTIKNRINNINQLPNYLEKDT